MPLIFGAQLDPVLSERLDDLDQMLVEKLEDGNADILRSARGDPGVAKALKSILASLVSIRATDEDSSAKLIILSSTVARAKKDPRCCGHPWAVCYKRET